MKFCAGIPKQNEICKKISDIVDKIYNSEKIISSVYRCLTHFEDNFKLFHNCLKTVCLKLNFILIHIREKMFVLFIPNTIIHKGGGFLIKKVEMVY